MYNFFLIYGEKTEVDEGIFFYTRSFLAFLQHR